MSTILPLRSRSRAPSQSQSRSQRTPSLPPPTPRAASHHDSDPSTTASTIFDESSSHLPYTSRRPAAPSSVTSHSRASYTQPYRKHSRSHRSQHGGASGRYAPAGQNEFPIFSVTGDVELVLKRGRGPERRYVLHRLILAQNSGVFAAGLSEEWAGRDPGGGENPVLSRIGEDDNSSGASGSLVGGARAGPQGRGGKTVWRYELDPDCPEDEVPVLVKTPARSSDIFGGDSSQPPPVRNKPAPPQQGFYRTMSAIQSAMHIPSSYHARDQELADYDEEDDTIRDYNNLLLIFYNHPPLLSASSITTAYTQCKGLLNLADMYDALSVVGPRIDHHLLQFQSRLWKQIAKYPPSYLKLGYLARSRTIFAEALIHTVGMWPLGQAQLRTMPEPVHDLIRDKVEDLNVERMQCELRLARLTLYHNGAPVSPKNNFADWLAVCLFRAWLAENTRDVEFPVRDPGLRNEGPEPEQPDTFVGDRAIRLVSKAGQGYLGHEEVKRFVKAGFPGEYGREKVRRVEARVEELKEMARGVVAALARSRLQMEGPGAVYLTCCEVREEDFPW